jgi:phosphotransferase system enzyme I (PtsP)
MKRDHAKLICDVGELSDIFQDAPSMDAFLQRIVELIAEHMAADVCSIYLYYEEGNELVLKATKGLNPTSVNQVKMKLGEGLTGKALEELRPICEGDASSNPGFRFFPGIGEERFESLLAVPMMRGNIRIGAIVIQSEKKDYFNDDDIYVFRAITSQLVHTIETAKLFMTLNDAKKGASHPKPALDIKLVKGRVGSEGVSHAPAIVLTENLTELTRYLSHVYKSFTIDDFNRAVEMTEHQLSELQSQVESALYDVASLIFTAQILMLKDKSFISGITGLIEKGETPIHAIVQVVEGYVKKLGMIDDAYLRDKIHDVKDVGRRILENLAGESDTHHEYEGKLVIAHELLPSDALKLSSQNVKGIIVLSGGVTSHLSILARSLNIPLVITDEHKLLSLEAGTPILLDAMTGHIHVNPHKDLVNKVFEREDLNKDIGSLKTLVQKNLKTKDNVRIHLLANINLLGDVKAACEFNAQGVGLYRTEFPFLMRSTFPTEEEQYQIYRRLLEGMKGKEVTFRTLDIGGDKVLSYYNNGKEENPFLGLRSIRFSLRHKDIFIQQIRAILKAGVGHDIRIMFPMISSLDEYYSAREIVYECSRELTIQKEEHHSSPKMGIMIELPSVLEIIDDLAGEVDFFSIGTNDFIQYILAVDRTNEKVADMYVPHHPAILRSLNKVAKAGKRFGKTVSICGDMAHDVRYLPFLIGIGFRYFSVDPRYLPRMHQKIAALSTRESRLFAKRILSKATVLETSQLINEN